MRCTAAASKALREYRMTRGWILVFLAVLSQVAFSPRDAAWARNPAVVERRKNDAVSRANSELFDGVQHDDLAKVKAALAAGARLDARDIDGQTPLMWAADAGD